MALSIRTIAWIGEPRDRNAGAASRMSDGTFTAYRILASPSIV
jgi:hypothetical protein